MKNPLDKISWKTLFIILGVLIVMRFLLKYMRGEDEIFNRQISLDTRGQ